MPRYDKKSTIPGMPLIPVCLWGYYCYRCGHRWVPRGLLQVYRAKVKGGEEPLGPTDPGKEPEQKEEPRVCPACKSPYWNRVKEER